MKRFLLNLVAFLSVFCLPAFLAGCVLVCLIFMQENFAEIVFWAYLIDVLSSGGKVFGSFPPYFFTVVIGLIFIASYKLKDILRIYPVA